MDKSTAAGLYTKLEHKRDSYLRRGRDVARVTIPHLLTEDGHSHSTKLATPYQSVGARGVSNLASKLLLSLLPPSQPFFRLQVDPFTLEQLTGMEDARTEVEASLAEIENAVHGEIESMALRIQVFEALKQLVICGNALLYLPPDGQMRVYKMDRYVIQRDYSGNIDLIVIKETISPAALPEEIREMLPSESTGSPDGVDIYTCVHRQDEDTYEVYQEVAGQTVESTYGTFKADKLPYLALRMNGVTGMDWGYGYCAELLGDLQSLEALSQAMIEAAAAASKVLFLVDPASPTRARTLAESPNGAIREGRADDVSVLSMGSKAADMRIAYEAVNNIAERLGFAFMLNTSIQRKGERVTAEEIRFMAQELEDYLAGAYSLLSQELQLPLVNLVMDRMRSQNRLPKIPKEIVKPTVVTGIEALGRGHDLTRLDVFIAGAMQTFGPEMLNQYIDIRDYLERRATALGLPMKGLVKTQEQIQQETQQAQMQNMVQQFGPQVMDMAQKNMEAQPPEEG
jgi:hypothetical protein